MRAAGHSSAIRFHKLQPCTVQDLEATYNAGLASARDTQKPDFRKMATSAEASLPIASGLRQGHQHRGPELGNLAVTIQNMNPYDRWFWT